MERENIDLDNIKMMITTGVLLCTGMIFLCGRMLFSYKEQSQNTAQDDSGNAVSFYENADKQGIERKKAQKYWERLLADNIFQDDMMMGKLLKKLQKMTITIVAQGCAIKS
ncbi:MAG: hypothetical protein NC231_13170 [Bacillus sp. (in: Bacteria)]|nr:hypothetical protein [Bacillus sp. (in: firmicutes)]MCM1426387.1 hypothetical protein [Eubacterium sp.]